MLTYEWVSDTQLKITHHMMSLSKTKLTSFFYDLKNWTRSESIDGMGEIKMTPDEITDFKACRLQHAINYFKKQEELKTEQKIKRAIDKIKSEYSIGTVTWYDEESDKMPSLMIKIGQLKNTPVQLSIKGVEKIFRDHDVELSGKMYAKKSGKNREKGEFCGVINITNPEFKHLYFI